MEEAASYKQEVTQLVDTLMVHHHCKEVAFHLGEDTPYFHHQEA
jgi:hypothetical protein